MNRPPLPETFSAYLAVMGEWKVKLQSLLRLVDYEREGWFR
jgi:hypothetical protein